MASSLKKGMKLTPPQGSSWHSSASMVELLEFHRVGNYTYWWVRRTDKYGIRTFDTIMDVSLTAWDPVKEFYQTGKRYKFAKDSSKDVYEVIELHQVDRPITAEHDVAAVAKCHDNYSGKVYLTVLSRGDFTYMVEA